MRATFLLLLTACFSLTGYAMNPEERKRCSTYFVEAQTYLAKEDSAWEASIQGLFEAPVTMSYRLMERHGASLPLAARAFFTQLGQATLAHYLLRPESVPPNLEALARLSGVSVGEVAACFDRARQDTELLSYFARVHAVFFAFDLPPELSSALWMNPYFIPAVYYLVHRDTEKALLPLRGVLGAIPPRFRDSLASDLAGAIRLRPGIPDLVTTLVKGRGDAAPSPGEILLNNRHLASGAAQLAAYLENQTFGTAAQANESVRAFWQKHFAFPISFQGVQRPFHEVALQAAGLGFQAAMTLEAKGHPQGASLLRRQTAARLRAQGVIIDEGVLGRLDHLYGQLADTAEARALTWGSFAARDIPTPEALLVHYLSAPHLPEENFDGIKVPVFRGRPQQLAMAKAVLEFTFSQPGSRFLEVGYGTPMSQAILPGLAGGAQFDGLDLFPPNEDAADLLAQFGGRLFHGNLPADRQAAAALQGRVPYTAVYGVDVFRATYGGFGKDLALGVSNADYLRWVHSLLADGGVFLALNDNDEPLVFTEAECKAAGFSVVRWGVRRSLPEAQRALFAPRPTKVGEMRLYVLRKGREATPR